MRLFTRARRAMASTREPARPLAENSARAAARIRSRVRWGSRATTVRWGLAGAVACIGDVTKRILDWPIGRVKNAREVTRRAPGRLLLGGLGLAGGALGGARLDHFRRRLLLEGGRRLLARRRRALGQALLERLHQIDDLGARR